MLVIFKILCALIIVFAIIEICSRIYYKKRFKVKWRPKIIGEYPFNKFVYRCPAPLFFRFKEGYKSKKVTINSLGARGPEPAKDGEKRRLLLIGGSGFFGSKLLKEKDVWSNQLTHILEEHGIKNWEVINGGFPGYNIIQYLSWWENTLKNTKPDILIIELGVNDISQAYVMGDKWSPGTPWSWNFILKLQRKSKWWQKILFYSCFYFLCRRRQITERKGFESTDNTFKIDECIKTVVENTKKIINDAESMGCKIILTTFAPAYDLKSLEENPPQLDAIQSNWRESLKSTGKPIIEFSNWWINEFAKELNKPSLNLMEIFWNHPKRYEMYHDLFHWNGEGHYVIAKAIFNKITELNWW